MSPRPRSVPNSDILEGASRAVSRLGAARLTLADVAEEVGLAPATLIQRFGSKRAMLLALADYGTASIDVRLQSARESNQSPLAALVETAGDVIADTPEALANQLAFLQFELGDPDFHQVALERAERTRAGYHSLLDEAVAAGELMPCDTDRLSRTIQTLAMGALTNWAVYREGSARECVAADIGVMLEPHRSLVVSPGAADAAVAPTPGRSGDADVATVPRSVGPRTRHSAPASSATHANPLPAAADLRPAARPTGSPLRIPRMGITGSPSPNPRGRDDL